MNQGCRVAPAPSCNIPTLKRDDVPRTLFWGWLCQDLVVHMGNKVWTRFQANHTPGIQFHSCKTSAVQKKPQLNLAGAEGAIKINDKQINGIKKEGEDEGERGAAEPRLTCLSVGCRPLSAPPPLVQRSCFSFQSVQSGNFIFLWLILSFQSSRLDLFPNLFHIIQPKFAR